MSVFIDVHFCRLLLDHVQFILIHEPHRTWAFPLWPSHFILSGAISLLLPLDTFWLGVISFSIISFFFLPFHTVHRVLMARILKWVAISFSGGPCFVRTLHCDPSVLGGAAWHGLWLHWVMQAPSPRQGCDPWRGTKLRHTCKAFTSTVPCSCQLINVSWHIIVKYLEYIPLLALMERN